MADSSAGPSPAPSPTSSSTPPLGPEDRAYVETVRRATARLGVRQIAPDDIRGAVEELRDVTHFDVDVPVSGQRREVRMVKTAVKRVSDWYLRSLAAQLEVFGRNVVRLAEAVAERSERVESSVGEATTRLGALEERVRRLEDRAGGS